MFYKLLAGGVVATFGGVFWLSAPSTGPAAPPAPVEAPGHLIAMPVRDVYEAIRDMKRGEFKSQSEVAQIIGGAESMDSVKVERMPDQSITWYAKAGKHRAIDLTVRLRPTADGTGTLVNFDYLKHPLPTGEAARRVEYFQKVAYLRFGQMLSDELKEIDPAFADQVRKDANRPLMAEGMMTAVRVAANPVAIMKQAHAMERDIRSLEKDMDDAAAAERRNRPPPSTPGVTFDPGKPMVDPSTPAGY